jgi:hypothetical protein
LQMTMLFSSEAERNAALAAGMTDGMSLSYDRLEEFASTARR